MKLMHVMPWLLGAQVLPTAAVPAHVALRHHPALAPPAGAGSGPIGAAGPSAGPVAQLAPPAAAEPIPADAVRLRATVQTAIERALDGASPRYGRALAAEAARLLRWRGQVPHRVRPGDRIELVFVPPSASAPPAQEPTLLALRYEGEQLQLEAYRFVDPQGIARYYDRDGQLVEPHMLNAPVPAYAQITEVVQHGRGRRRHRGDDLKAEQGARVVLPFPGVVRRINWSRRVNGHCIEVMLDAGYTAHFLHMEHIDARVRPGVRLAAGAALGTVGNTGHSSGAHLHYELLRRQQPVEPLLVHGRRVVRLGPQALARFLPWRDRLLRHMRGGEA